MWKQTHLFSGVQVAIRQFGVMPEDYVVREIGTNNNPGFTKRLLKKYPRIVAYTFLTIHSRNGNNIDARSNNNSESSIIWVPENEGLLEWIIKSSNAVSVLDSIEDEREDTPQRQNYEKKLQAIFDMIRWRITGYLTCNRSTTLDNGAEQYNLNRQQRLDSDFQGFPFPR